MFGLREEADIQEMGDGDGMEMTGSDESKIRREGFPITRSDATALLDFIDIKDSEHDMIEPEIIVKLELLAGRYVLSEVMKCQNIPYPHGDDDK